MPNGKRDSEAAAHSKCFRRSVLFQSQNVCGVHLRDPPCGVEAAGERRHETLGADRAIDLVIQRMRNQMVGDGHHNKVEAETRKITIPGGLGAAYDMIWPCRRRLSQ